ncbi:hypothetical protein PCE1_000884 [Barthelona sp. PCE]
MDGIIASHISPIFTPDDYYLIISTGNEIRWISCETYMIAHTVTTPHLKITQMHQANNKFYTSGSEGNICCWSYDFPTQTEWDLNIGYQVYNFVVSSNDEDVYYIIRKPSKSKSNDKVYKTVCIYRYSFINQETTRISKSRHFSVDLLLLNDVIFFLDGTKLCLIDSDRRDIETIYFNSHLSTLIKINNNSLALCEENGCISVLSGNPGDWQTTKLHWHHHCVNDMKAGGFNTGTLLTGGIEGVLVAWSLSTHRPSFTPRLSKILSVCASHDGAVYCATTAKNEIHFIDAGTMQVSKTLSSVLPSVHHCTVSNTVLPVTITTDGDIVHKVDMVRKTILASRKMVVRSKGAGFEKTNPVVVNRVAHDPKTGTVLVVMHRKPSNSVFTAPFNRVLVLNENLEDVSHIDMKSEVLCVGFSPQGNIFGILAGENNASSIFSLCGSERHDRPLSFCAVDLFVTNDRIYLFGKNSLYIMTHGLQQIESVLLCSSSITGVIRSIFCSTHCAVTTETSTIVFDLVSLKVVYAIDDFLVSGAFMRDSFYYTDNETTDIKKLNLCDGKTSLISDFPVIETLIAFESTLFGVCIDRSIHYIVHNEVSEEVMEKSDKKKMLSITFEKRAPKIEETYKRKADVDDIIATPAYLLPNAKLLMNSFLTNFRTTVMEDHEVEMEEVQEQVSKQVNSMKGKNAKALNAITDTDLQLLSILQEVRMKQTE